MNTIRTANKEQKQSILLVEDDSEIAKILSEVLAENGFNSMWAASAEKMDAYLEDNTADLVILDVMLPGESGLSICRRLRATSLVPIIMLTARSEDVDRIIGLEIGADDYVTKPFNHRELLARIHALLRRSHISRPPNDPFHSAFRFEGWRVEPGQRQLFSPEGARVTLTSTEFDLLLAFCQNSRRILTREQLLELTHSGIAGPIGRSVDVHISRIRQKIEPDLRSPTFIKTVRLGGYVFTPSIEIL
ncbi:response regulator transcription factor [Agrobacterium rhizogenes]|jgi:two-component system OmpR family response regulator|uniref:Response regulator transcription factor n=2 Tax=unclassified Rhizobium TaxID=2613769 RepID=A0AAU7SL66_9HYPH|nr:response regulator transcription factor [Rhizobium rhizogenes]NTJ80548.1 response regulator transcription factor [Rhizobium rhizogenes]